MIRSTASAHFRDAPRWAACAHLGKASEVRQAEFG
jgi:hypothetical protein